MSGEFPDAVEDDPDLDPDNCAAHPFFAWDYVGDYAKSEEQAFR